MFDGPTPEHPEDGAKVLDALAAAAEAGITSPSSPGFFGWVMGGSHPLGVAADMMTSAWGQNVASYACSPAGAMAKKVGGRWLLDILGLEGAGAHLVAVMRKLLDHPLMGIVGGIVIAIWSWNLLRDTAAVLLDSSDPHLETEVREEVEAQGDARITDLHVWRVGPGVHAAIVSFTGSASPEDVRGRLRSVHQLAHVTVEARYSIFLSSTKAQQGQKSELLVVVVQPSEERASLRDYQTIHSLCGHAVQGISLPRSHRFHRRLKMLSARRWRLARLQS